MGRSQPAAGSYKAAVRGASFTLRDDRGALRVAGRAAGEMLKGIVTSGLPSEGIGADVVYSALLTPKGKMVTDMRIFPDPGSGGYLLDLPDAGRVGALAHFGRYLPPRLAQVTDLSGSLRMVTIVGPDGPALIARARKAGGAVTPPWKDAEMLAEKMEGLPVGSVITAPVTSPEDSSQAGISPEDGSAGGGWITRNDDVRAPAWDVILPTNEARSLAASLEEAGAEPMDPVTFEILRVERGRPAFGRDMTEITIPLEAGIEHRAIDHGKGCYIGQEVVVRIRDRGGVARRLTGFLLGDASVPDQGTEIFEPGVARGAGWITSACRSPAFGETIALGYLARRVEVGGIVRVGGPDGPVARVRALTEDAWAPPDS